MENLAAPSSKAAETSKKRVSGITHRKRFKEGHTNGGARGSLFRRTNFVYLLTLFIYLLSTRCRPWTASSRKCKDAYKDVGIVSAKHERKSKKWCEESLHEDRMARNKIKAKGDKKGNLGHVRSLLLSRVVRVGRRALWFV